MLNPKTTNKLPSKKAKTSSNRSGGLVSYVADRVKEPTTWMGLLSLGAAFATGGASTWLNPSTLPTLAMAVGMILGKEG